MICLCVWQLFVHLITRLLLPVLTLASPLLRSTSGYLTKHTSPFSGTEKVTTDLVFGSERGLASVRSRSPIGRRFFRLNAAAKQINNLRASGPTFTFESRSKGS